MNIKQIIIGALCMVCFQQMSFATDTLYHVNSGKLMQEGIQLHDEGKYSAAVEKYQQIPENDTNYTWSLYEIALSARIDSQFTLAKQACFKGLEWPGAYEHDFLIELGNIYDTESKFDSAGYYFDMAVQKFPRSLYAKHAKGINLFLRKDYDAAVQVFQDIVITNPYAFNSHYYLGLIAQERGYPIQAMLSFATNLLLSPNNNRYNLSIRHLVNLAEMSDTVVASIQKRKQEKYFNEKYEDIETLFKSKIALEKAYEVNASFNEPFIKQLHLILEKLPENVNTQEFWNSYYGLFLKKIFRDKKFDAATLRMISNINNEAVQKKVKQSSREINEVVEILDEYLGKIGYCRNTNMAQYDNAKPGFIFGDYKLLGYGKLVNNDRKKLSGNWIFFNAMGDTSSVATYDNGKLDGPYQSFYYNRNTKEKYQYRSDKLVNEAKEYYLNGVLKAFANFDDGKLQGEKINYYTNGHIETVVSFNKGVKSGPCKSYYENGEIHYDYQMNNDIIEGEVKEYYNNGKLYSTVIYKKGKAEGEWVSYHQNGTLREKGNMISGMKEGLFTTLNDEGKMISKVNYSKDKMDGEAIYFYENGNPLKKIQYDKGEKNGLSTEYAENGNASSITTYKNNRIVSVKFYNTTNQQLIREKELTDKKNNNLLLYNEVGCLTGEINCTREGVYNGSRTKYFLNGKVASMSNYVMGLQEGEEKTYYNNGQIQTQYQYEKDKLVNTYKRYHYNGKLSETGMYVDGMVQGIVYAYHDLGTIKEKDFFVNDALHGKHYYYAANGKLRKTIRYQRGIETEMVEYDTLGKIIQRVLINPLQAQKITEHTILGAPKRTYTFEHNQLHGEDIGWYPDGSVEYKTQYKHGQLEGNYVSYYVNGQIKSTGEYVMNKQHGRWVRYDYWGRLSGIYHYKNGESEGTDSIYSEQGILDFIVQYKNDERHGLAKKTNPTDGAIMYVNTYVDGLIVQYTYENKEGWANPILVNNCDSITRIEAFFKNGQQSMEGYLSNGDYEGLRKLYYPNGKLQYEATYINNKRHGEEKEYYPSGKLLSSATYSQGELDGKYVMYDENGNILFEQFYYYGYPVGTHTYMMPGKGTKKITYYWGEEIQIQ